MTAATQFELFIEAYETYECCHGIRIQLDAGKKNSYRIRISHHDEYATNAIRGQPQPDHRGNRRHNWPGYSSPPPPRKIGTCDHLSTLKKTRLGGDQDFVRAKLVQHPEPTTSERSLFAEEIVIPTQLRQTVPDSLHLTHPGSPAMLDSCQRVSFPHIHRSIFQMAQSCRHFTEQSKNLKPIIGKQHSFQIEPVVQMKKYS